MGPRCAADADTTFSLGPDDAAQTALNRWQSSDRLECGLEGLGHRFPGEARAAGCGTQPLFPVCAGALSPAGVLGDYPGESGSRLRPRRGVLSRSFQGRD